MKLKQRSQVNDRELLNSWPGPGKPNAAEIQRAAFHLPPSSLSPPEKTTSGMHLSESNNFNKTRPSRRKQRWSLSSWVSKHREHTSHGWQSQLTQPLPVSMTKSELKRFAEVLTPYMLQDNTRSTHHLGVVNCYWYRLYVNFPSAHLKDRQGGSMVMGL